MKNGTLGRLPQPAEMKNGTIGRLPQPAEMKNGTLGGLPQPAEDLEQKNQAFSDILAHKLGG